MTPMPFPADAKSCQFADAVELVCSRSENAEQMGHEDGESGNVNLAGKSCHFGGDPRHLVHHDNSGALAFSINRPLAARAGEAESLEVEKRVHERLTRRAADGSRAPIAEH